MSPEDQGAALVALTFGALIVIGFASLGCAAFFGGEPIRLPSFRYKPKHLNRAARRQKERTA
jgi:hypothetical protein